MVVRSSKVIAAASCLCCKSWLSVFSSHLVLWRAEAEMLPKRMRPSFKILVVAFPPLSVFIIAFPYLNLLFLAFLFQNIVIYLQSFHTIQKFLDIYPISPRCQQHQWNIIGYTSKYIPSHYLLSQYLSKLFIFIIFYINLSLTPL